MPKSTSRTWFQKLGGGALAYRLYHVPKGFLRRCVHEGPINLWLSNRGKRAMEKAATKLPPLNCSTDRNETPVYFLSGQRFWYQTAFCAHSLLKTANRPLRIAVVDDGTFTRDLVDQAKSQFPGIEIELKDEIETRLNKSLPVERFPTLRARRLIYPHLKKLTDIHAGRTGWKLVLDSDMLFFRKPEFLLKWLENPGRPCHMIDIQTSYGYSQSLMEELTGATIADRLNVGICGLKSESIDWEKLEYWCKTLQEREGSHYFQEQALTAMLMAKEDCAIAGEEDYIALPRREQVKHAAGVMHHYVAESKAWYFRFGWRLAGRQQNA